VSNLSLNLRLIAAQASLILNQGAKPGEGGNLVRAGLYFALHKNLT
jgi:hypothetical protein